jgi:1-aminocyclopropane-1-carboxylate deaminase/D-cysteine desulfhydrase-like pyridoxal-dependent ACC family enzyme
LAARIGLRPDDLWVKRDDWLGLGGGGSKLRKLEFLLDRMLTSVAGEVAVVAVDHRQAGTHVAREVEGRRSGTKRKGLRGFGRR